MTQSKRFYLRKRLKSINFILNPVLHCILKIEFKRYFKANVKDLFEN